MYHDAAPGGKIEKWKGYKLHLVVGDGDIPLCAFLSSASMHDSQAMIPMMQRASASFDYFYDLADAAYDAAGTRAMSQSLNHVPLIDGNPRRGEKQIDDVGAKFVNIVPAELDRPEIRKILCNNYNYWIYYRVQKRVIEILSVRHTLMNIRTPKQL